MNEPPNSWYFAPYRSGHAIVWITRSSGFWTSQTCGSSEPRSKWRIAAPVRCPWVPSASSVALAIRSEPGSKFDSSSPSRPRPLSPERTPTTRPSSTSSFDAAVSPRMYTPASSAWSESQRPSCATDVTWLPWLRNGGGVGLSGIARFEFGSR